MAGVLEKQQERNQDQAERPEGMSMRSGTGLRNGDGGRPESCRGARRSGTGSRAALFAESCRRPQYWERRKPLRVITGKEFF
jgi:hypothetical protein